MATAKTTKTQLPKTNKTAKSAKKSAQTLKNAPKTRTSRKTTAKVTPINRKEVEAKIEVLKSDLAELTSSLKESGAEYVDAKTADARAAAADVRDAAYAKAEIAKDKYSELAADTEARIRANPLTAVAIAAGVGLLFGAMSRR